MIHITFENQETYEFQNNMIDEIFVLSEMFKDNGIKIMCVRYNDFGNQHAIADYCNWLNNNYS